MAGLHRTVGNAAVVDVLSRGDEGRDRRTLARGRPLDPAIRRFMEDRFDRGFGDVRVHTGASADASVHELDAHAYTVGDDIVFRSDLYRPDTEPGLRMLAHELAHVVQQRSGTVVPGQRMDGADMTDPTDASEREADRLAHTIVPPRRAPPPIPQRAIPLRTRTRR